MISDIIFREIVLTVISFFVMVFQLIILYYLSKNGKMSMENYKIINKRIDIIYKRLDL